MSIYTLIPIIFIVLYAGYWYYVKNKNSQQAQVVNNTDFKAEFEIGRASCRERV